MKQEKTTYLSIFRLGKRTLIISATIGLVLAIIVSIIQPLQYSSQASVLVIPNTRSNMDGYQATRSAEKYALTLTSVIPTMSFYNKVVTENPELASLFPEEEEKQREQWKRDMQAGVVPETGILSLSAYAKRPGDAQSILAAAINVLEKEGPAYLGGHSSALIYMIDTPIASSLPVRPNYPLNVLGGIVAGLLVGAVYVFVRSESTPKEVAEIAPEEIEKVEEETGSETRVEEDEFEMKNESDVEEKQWYPNNVESEKQPVTQMEQLDPWVTLKHNRN
jgi:capsular polysaccharide biosynthesis protein